MGEGAEEALRVLGGRGDGGKGVGAWGGSTDVEMVSIFFRWKLSSFFDYAVPAIVGSIFVNLFTCHGVLFSQFV